MKTLRMLAILIVLLWAGSALAANTITTNTKGIWIVTLSAIDTDWTWTDTFPSFTSGMKIQSIRFNPGAAADQCIIKAGTDAGPEIFNSSVAQSTGDGTIQYYDTSKRLRPMLDVTAGTYNAGAFLTIIFAE